MQLSYSDEEMKGAVLSDVAERGWRKYLAPKKLVRLFGELLAWAYFMLAGCGGLFLILKTGPLPLTHGWYAMFSGIAWCPATAWLLKRYARVALSYWVRFAIAAIFFALGHIALIVRIWPFG